ncbi:hypothetical protein [Bacillus sp. BP-3]|uniref:hypothetical protein n=1 Tax=Bacillus sp. BP-3 TaxID=3022773 RepID=UPI002330B8D7|nr:hypothetical protein [Bacillus sp. BP-3]
MTYMDIGKVFMKDVDKDENVIKTYSKAEIKQIQQPTQQQKQNGLRQNMNGYSLNAYPFGAMSFSSYKWIWGGTMFYRSNTIYIYKKQNE